MIGGQFRAALVEPEFLAGDLEPPPDHPGHRAGALHPRSPLRVVVAAAAHVADQREDVAIAVGIIRHQPFAEQVAHLQRQPQQHVACFLDAGMRRRIENALDLGIVQRGDHRSDHHRGRNSRFRQSPQRLQPPRRRRGARLHGARQLRIQRRHRNRHLGEIALGHPRQNVDVAHHQRRLRDDADRMAGAIQHFENAAHDLVLALDRLIGIGIGADRDHARLVVLRRQLLFQQLRRIGLGEQLRFEIEPRRQAEIGVGRPREAVDAAMLAAPVGVDRAVEADIGRIVAGDHLSRGIQRDRGLERRQFFEALPAVVERDPRFGLKAAAGVGLRAAAAPPRALDGDRQFGKRRRRTRRLGGRRDRRVLEGTRGCSAHDVYIARRENKSRTIARTNRMCSRNSPRGTPARPQALLTLLKTDPITMPFYPAAILERIGIRSL